MVVEEVAVGRQRVFRSNQASVPIAPYWIENLFTKKYSIKETLPNFRRKGRDVDLRCSFESVSEEWQD